MAESTFYFRINSIATSASREPDGSVVRGGVMGRVEVGGTPVDSNELKKYPLPVKIPFGTKAYRWFSEVIRPPSGRIKKPNSMVCLSPSNPMILYRVVTVVTDVV